MNDWGPAREVEKVKKPTRAERHAQLRHDVGQLMKRLGHRDLAIEAALGANNPIRLDLQECARLFDRLIDELQGASS